MEYKIYLEGMTARILKHVTIVSVACYLPQKYHNSNFYHVKYKVKRGRKEHGIFVPKNELFMAVIY
jgi:hypothetical protein